MPGNEQTMRPGMWVAPSFAEFAVLILRRAAVEDENGVPPTPAAIQLDAEINHRDLRTLHAALGSVRDDQGVDSWAPQGTPVAVGRTQTVGPQGAAMAAIGLIAAEVTL
jgi:hypothetical protein